MVRLWHRLVGSRSPGRGARGSSTRRLRHYNPLILAFPELVEIDKIEVDDETKGMDKVNEVDTTKALLTIVTEVQAFLELEVDDIDVEYCRSPLSHL